MRTLAGRVTVLTVLVVALGFTLTGAIIVQVTGRAQVRALEADLGERLAQFEQAARLPRPGSPQARPGPGVQPGDIQQRFDQIRRAAERALGPGTFLIVRTQRAGVVLRLGEVPETLPPAPTGSSISSPGSRGLSPGERHEDPSTGVTYLVRSAQLQGPSRASLQIGADLDRAVTGELAGLRRRFLLVGGVATALAGVATALVTSLATAPLRRLREATVTVAQTEDLTTRVHLDDATREVEAVADGLNTMLARLERSASARESALTAARRFAADAGHELRTPLTSMQTTLDSLQRNPHIEPEMRAQAITEVAEETRRLAHLVESLQILARADAAGAVPQVQVPFEQVIADAVTHARSTYPHVRITADLEAATVHGAAPWLRSIADNLLRNAAVHAPPATGAPVHIDVSLHDADGWVLLTVDDDGTGIPADVRPRVLERFSRGADSSNRPGSGLGLSLVAQLAALHGGAIRLGDAPAGGLRVQVRLPTAADPEVPRPPGDARPVRATGR